MSDLDDLDDFYNDSFENDKKIRPPAAPQKQTVQSKVNDQQKAVKQVDDEDDFNVQQLEESIDESPKQNQKEDDYDFYEDQEKNQKIPIIPRQQSQNQQQQKPQSEQNRIVRQNSKHSEQNAQQSQLSTAKKHENVIPTTNSIQNSVVTSNNKQTLVEKNKKLKLDLKMLATELDKILIKEKEKREERYSKKEEDDELKDRKLKVQKQVAEINKMKQNIVRLKNQLQNVYDNNNIVQKEDELLFLKKQIAEVKTEYDGLSIINEKQQQALNELKDNGQYSQNVDKLRSTLMKVKEDYRKLNDQVQEQEKELRKQHETLVTKEDNIRSLNERIHEKKKAQNSHQSQVGDEDVYDRDIEELEEKIKEQKNKKKQIEKKYMEKQKAIDDEKRELQQQLSRKLTILKSKEKEMKLNQIKLKEVEKYIKNMYAKDDAKSVVSESHIDNMNRDNSKNAKQLKRPPIFHKKPVANAKQGEIKVENQQDHQRERSLSQKKQNEYDEADRGRKKERTPERDIKNPSNKKLRDQSPEQHQKENKPDPKKQVVGQKKPTEEEVDLDELEYQNEFDDFESRQNTGQGNRQYDQIITPINNDQSYQNQSKNDESFNKYNEPSQQSKNQFQEFDNDKNSNSKNENKDQSFAKEEKQEEEDVFSKPSFMLKKKK